VSKLPSKREQDSLLMPRRLELAMLTKEVKQELGTQLMVLRRDMVTQKKELVKVTIMRRLESLMLLRTKQ
jgi:hypothetical protein